MHLRLEPFRIECHSPQEKHNIEVTSVTIKKLDDHVSVSQQISPADISLIAAQGFKAIINNRPDGEEDGQVSAATLAAAARAANLEYVHIPITPGAFTDELIAAQREAIAQMPGPVLAFCRTGTRCAIVWGAMNAGDIGVDAVLETTQEVGYDLGAMAPLFEKHTG